MERLMWDRQEKYLPPPLSHTHTHTHTHAHTHTHTEFHMDGTVIKEAVNQKDRYTKIHNKKSIN